MHIFEIQFAEMNGHLPHPIFVNEKGTVTDNWWNMDAVLGVSDTPAAGSVDVDFDELRKDPSAARGRYLVAISDGQISTYTSVIDEMREMEERKYA